MSTFLRFAFVYIVFLWNTSTKKIIKINMKKIILIFFVCLFIASIYGCSLNLEKSSNNLTMYSAILNFDEDKHTIGGKLEVDYFNKSNTELGSIFFNLYPNAFRETSNQDVISLAKYSECYYNGESFGSIEIKNVYNSNNLDFEISGVDENILIVNLNGNVLPQEYTNFVIDFEVNIPNISHRFGYGENTVNLGNILPIACVFESGKWIEIEYQSNGDPFFSEVANYDIEICYPQDYILASTGTETSNFLNNGKKTSFLKAKVVRDFMIVLSKNFVKKSQQLDNILVNYYYYNDENAEKSLQTCVLAMQTYCDLFGDYPYSEIKIVQANFCIGGMEFPNLVLVGDEVIDYKTYEYIIVHELAHQWWYGVVGNNQTKYAWLDEGLAEFSSAMFYKKNQGYDFSYDFLVKQANTSFEIYQTIFGNVLGSVDTSMDRSLAEFKTESEYINMIYVKGFLLFDSLCELLGEKTVINCLKEYYKDNAFKTTTPAELIGCFEKTARCTLESFFDSWIKGKIVQVFD